MNASRVLVVDDEASLRRVIQVQLQEMGVRGGDSSRWCGSVGEATLQ